MNSGISRAPALALALLMAMALLCPTLAQSCASSAACPDRTPMCLTASCIGGQCTYTSSADGTLCGAVGTCSAGVCRVVESRGSWEMTSDDGNLLVSAPSGAVSGDLVFTPAIAGSVRINECAVLTQCDASIIQAAISGSQAALRADLEGSMSGLRSSLGVAGSTMRTQAALIADLASLLNDTKTDVRNVGSRLTDVEELSIGSDQVIATQTSSIKSLQLRLKEVEDILSTLCTPCQPGFYFSQPCTPSSRGVCSQCTGGSFSDGGFVVSCTKCKGTCPPSFGRIRQCNSTSDDICQACTDGFFNAGNTTSPCSKCLDPCPGSHVESIPCTPTSDRKCVACGSCPEGSYISSNCSSNLDRVCTSCSACAGANQRAIGGCSGTTNTICGTLTNRAFTYTGTVQSFAIPALVFSINATMWGAAGGGSSAEGQAFPGGPGGYVTGTINVAGLTFLNVYVGQGGVRTISNSNPAASWPGITTNSLSGKAGRRSSYNSGYGGGRSEVTTVTGVSLMIAGAGGGAGGTGWGTQGTVPSSGGAGGGTTGQDGGIGNCVSGLCGGTGRGGTQSAGGVAGNGVTFTTAAQPGGLRFGGYCDTSFDTSSTSCNALGGGGDGYFGGGCGGAHGGGGGGSSYFHPIIVTSGTTSSSGAASTNPTNPPGTANPLYNGAAGKSGANVDGQHGYVVLSYYA